MPEEADAVAEETAFEREDSREDLALASEEAAEPVAVEASELMLASAEEAPLSMEERAEEAAPSAEETLEPSEDSMELRADEAPLAPGIAEVTWLAMEEATEERRDSTWAEARPAPAIMAMVEKRIVMKFGGFGVGFDGVVEVIELTKVNVWL